MVTCIRFQHRILKINGMFNNQIQKLPLGERGEIWYTGSQKKGADAVETATPRKTTLILAVVAAILTALTVVMLASLPYIVPEPESTEPPAQVYKEPTQTEPTEPEPTLLPLDLNPYGHLDFQFENGFLRCQVAESIVGIDVSAHQGLIDWEKVKEAGVDFAIIRVGYRGYLNGQIVEDAYARQNLQAAAEAGLQIGAYFFSQALSVEEALEEAQFTVDMLDGLDITMPVAFDWEFVNADARTNGMDADTLTACSLAFLKAVEEAGYWPMLYFNRNQAANYLHMEQLEDFDFWLAAYTYRMTYPYAVNMWQYTDNGRVRGIDTNVDINIYFPEIE